MRGIGASVCPRAGDPAAPSCLTAHRSPALHRRRDATVAAPSGLATAAAPRAEGSGGERGSTSPPLNPDLPSTQDPGADAARDLNR